MSDNNELPVWDLSPLVDSENRVEVKKSMDECLKQAAAIEEKYKGRVKDLSPSEVHKMYRELDRFRMNALHLQRYAFLRQAQDAADSTANDLLEYSMKIRADIESKLVFYKIEITRALADRPEMIDEPVLKEYRHELEKAKKRGDYLLSERDEQLILNKDLYGIDSWSVLHERLRSTQKYKVVLEGEEKEMVFAELQVLAEGSPDRNIRREAAEAYYSGVARDKLVYATALKCIFGDHLNQVKLRGHPSVQTQSLLDNDITQTILDELIASIKKRTHIIRRYLKCRAKVMGLEKLTGCDISPVRTAPVADTQSNIHWSEAKKLVLETFAGFDQESGEFIASLFEEKRIDAEIRSGKSASLFCMPIPAVRTCYIMMSFGGALHDIATLAHECGHGLHGYYTSHKHKGINFSAGACLAETGSIFAEMLLVDRLLQKKDDDETKLAILDRLLSNVYLMVYYMLNDYLFEESVFAAMENDEPVTADKLDSLWLAARTEVFGDSVDWLPGMEQWWVVPAHHFMPRFRFYNYPYSFAQLLALVLYRLYKEEGESFVPKMKHILSAGGSESPEVLLSEIGLDVTDPDFWNTGFELVESYLDEFEEIVIRLTRSK